MRSRTHITSISKLGTIGSASLGGSVLGCVGKPIEGSGTVFSDRLWAQLLDLLSRRNGFYAFESALHVFPLGNAASGLDLLRWNDKGLWKSEYGDLAKDYFFFAENTFGEGYCIYHDMILRFDPETAMTEPMASNFEEWAHIILDDYENETGFPFLHQWQIEHGPIKEGDRLIPRIPFACGGEYSLENLAAMNCVEAMRFRGYLAQQIRDLPDGTPIEFKIT